MKRTFSLFVLLFTLLPAFAPAQEKTPADERFLTYLRPIQEIELSTAESGIVTTVLVKPGDRVVKGQEILRLNLSVIEAQLAQAEAQAKGEGRLKAAAAERDIAQQRLDIIDDLRDRGSTNDAERDKAIASLAVAAGQLEAVEDERALYQLESATIRAQLDQRILRSPIDGVVTEVTRSVGEAAEARDADTPHYLAKVVDLTRLVARVHLPAAIAASLRLEESLPFVLDLPEKTRAEGIIRFISPTVDPATGLSEVHLEFDNSSGSLPSGLPGHLIVSGAD
jgi:RND family efflux transporter MFP subunit